MSADPCTYTGEEGYGYLLDFLGSDPHAGEKGNYYTPICNGAGGYTTWAPANQPAPRVSATELARQASSVLALPVPAPRTAPDRDDAAGSVTTVVNLHTWLWVDRASWGTRTRTTAVPGLAVTVTATPTATAWDLGDVREACGAGTPFTEEAVDDGDPTFGPTSPDCDYRATAAGTRTGSVTTSWHVTWAATDGETGALPDQATTATFAMTVSEYNAVIVQ